MILGANAMSNPSTPPPEPVQIVLARKIILLILLMIVAALGLVLLLRHIRMVSLLLPNIFSDAVTGLIAGCSARWVLGKQTLFLRIISILAFLIGGLELLGWFTGWQVGLGPLKFGLSSVDWYSLGQLLLGTSIALLTLFAWTLPAPNAVRPSPDTKSIKDSPPTRQQLKKRPTRSVRPKAPATEVKQSVEPKRKHLAHRKPQLQLSDKEEHRCPYCLELIDPDGPRGSVECNICHTLHHADCWAITGACQVPHYTS
jgi:hypothetical protein